MLSSFIILVILVKITIYLSKKPQNASFKYPERLFRKWKMNHSRIDTINESQANPEYKGYLGLYHDVRRGLIRDRRMQTIP